MSHPSKKKGTTFEREVVNKARQAGISACRAWGSNGSSLGYPEEVDLILRTFKPSGGASLAQLLTAQCKVRKRLSSIVRPSEEVDIQIIKEDRGTIYVVIPFQKFLEIISSPT